MILKNPWVGYLDRGYIQIKQAVIKRFKNLLPEVTDFSDSNIFMIILDYVASLVELLNYYIDNMARESYIYTAQHISSLIQQSRLIDYRMKTRVAATVDIRFDLVDNNGEFANNSKDVTIRKGTIVSGKGNVRFVTLRDKTLPTGYHSVTIPAEQIENKMDQYLGEVPEDGDSPLMAPTDYNHGSGRITINDEVWELVDTLAFSHSLDRHFMVDYLGNKQFYIKFGDGVHGKKPRAGEVVKISYQATYGELGNLEADSINKIDTLIQDGMDKDRKFIVSNPESATGGSSGESLEELREHLGCSIRTLDRAVTYEDFRDLAKLCPGVDKVGLDFKCEEGVVYYITPDDGGFTSQELMQRLVDFINPRKVLGVPVSVKPAGESKIILSLKVWGKFGKKYEDIREDVISALVEAYSYNNSDINAHVNTSDIIALVDNLSSVDHLDLVHLSLVPFARQSLVTNISFPGRIDLLSDASEKPYHADWTILVANIQEIEGVPTIYFQLGKNIDGQMYVVYTSDQFTITTEVTTVEFTFEFMKFTIDISQKLANTYAWDFSTYEINKNIPVEDNSVPTLSSNDITLEIIENNYETWKGQ